MDMVERYLEAVGAQLSVEEREDIVAELRDLILSRFEAREETLGRPLTDDEREAILREIGHPLVVAARYRKGPDSLIGPELFPYWLYGAKAGLLVLLAVAGIGLFIRLISGTTDVGQDIAHAFHGVFSSGLTLLGALTLAGAIMEHYGIRPKWLTNWRVRDLSAFQLSDPGQWGAAASGSRKARETWTPRLVRTRPPAGEAIATISSPACWTTRDMRSASPPTLTRPWKRSGRLPTKWKAPLPVPEQSSMQRNTRRLSRRARSLSSRRVLPATC